MKVAIPLGTLEAAPELANFMSVGNRRLKYGRSKEIQRLNLLGSSPPSAQPAIRPYEGHRRSPDVLGLGARWYFTDPWSVSVQATRFDDNLQQLMFGVGWGLRRNRGDDE